MKEIPTAEETLNRGLYDSGFELTGHQLKIIARNAKEFAKLHLEAQREAIKKNIKQKIVNPPLTRDEQYTIIDKQSIDDAYPLNNIK